MRTGIELQLQSPIIGLAVPFICFVFFLFSNEGKKSMNLLIRKELGLFAYVQRCYSFPGIITRHKDVDIVVVRENTEGEYSQVRTPFPCEFTNYAIYAFKHVSVLFLFFRSWSMKACLELWSQ